MLLLRFWVLLGVLAIAAVLLAEVPLATDTQRGLLALFALGALVG